ncbi:MAG: acyl-CoA dehydrogenase family protein [Thermodesulfobacteriota bacterium]
MALSGLDVVLNDEQRAMVETARRFAHEVMRPAGRILDKLDPEDVIKRDSELWDVYRKYHQMGFHKLIIPKALGGLEVDPLSWTLIVEQLGYGDAGLCESLACSLVPFLLTAAFGDTEMHSFVRAYCDDTEAKMVGCFAFTEPDHGSDWVLAAEPGMEDPKLAPNVKAVKKGAEYIINGQKSAFISNGPIATHALLILNVDSSKGMQGTGIAFLPLDLPGISRGKPLDKLGLRSYPQGAIIFDEVRIPENMMIVADPHAGFQTQQWILTPAGELLSAINVGLAQAAFDEALAYAKVRVQGGKPIIEHQSIKLKLFKMMSMIESARAFSRSLAQYNAGNPPGSAMHAQSSKVYCTETAFKVASEAMQILGAYGLSKEFPVEKMFRDARAGMIGEENNALSLLGASCLSREG